MVNEQERYKFVNEVGYEAFRHIIKRTEELGPLSYAETLQVIVGAANVCLANALRPGVEAAPNRTVAADGLSDASLKQVRAFLEHAVRENG